MDMNKLFKFYWKKENQMLIFQLRFFCWLFLFFFTFSFFYFFFLKCQEWSNSSLYCCLQWIWTNCSNFIGKRKTKCWSSKWGYFVDCFFFFSLSHFSFFFNVKGGVTPLFIAAQQGHEQIVQLLLKKGANVDLPNEVILLIVSFFFFSVSHFSIFFF